MMKLKKPEDAIWFLKTLNAPARLVVHHILVLEVTQELVKELQSKFRLNFDANLVLIGSAIHDCGKIVYPEEMTNPGSQHEIAGEQLLPSHQILPEIARFCRTHATWYDFDTVWEDWLVALADKIWKGRREKELESKIVSYIAQQTGFPEWEVFLEADSLFELIAAKGAVRLQQSIV
jgi:HD domain